MQDHQGWDYLMNHVVLTGRTAAVVGAAAFVLHATPALAHGFAGKRFFPATITNDDPFVADELSLPTADWFKNGERPAEGETDVSVEFSKRILDNLGISFEETWTHLDRRNEQNKSGFQNLETTLKYQFFTDAEHEAIVSAGLGVEWGDTGARKVGAESFSVLTPTIFFGKGAGDLPEDLNWLRPFAITGLIGYAVPTDEQHTTRSVNEDTGELEREIEKHSQTVAYGFSLEYSMPYLLANVRDVGLPSFLNRLWRAWVPCRLASPIRPCPRSAEAWSANRSSAFSCWSRETFSVPCLRRWVNSAPSRVPLEEHHGGDRGASSRSRLGGERWKGR
jgi:hypothetical protein